MAEYNDCAQEVSGPFKEAVCIDGGRVYDSCCDRDCLEDLRVCFSERAQAQIASARNIRVKAAKVVDVNIDVEPVSFNKGYYSCDLTFFFLVTFDLFGDDPCPDVVKGIATYTKKVILYGSEGNVRVFSNTESTDCCADRHSKKSSNMPRCVVQCVDPIALSSKLCDARGLFENCNIPSHVCSLVGGNVITELTPGSPAVYVTLGLFTIVQLIRNVQMLIPVYDFCIPQKQCSDSTDQPCDVFKKIKFPTDDFFPPRSLCDDDENEIGCSCAE